MKASELEKHRRMLLDLRRRVREDTDSRIVQVPGHMQALGDVSDVPTHNADHDAEGLDSEIGVGQAQETILGQVEGALHKIDAGTYGLCEECGGKIARARLEAIPYTPYCIECERKVESGE